MANLWPTTPSPFPNTFEVSGYSEEVPMNTVQTNPEAGSRIVRKRFSATPTKISGTMILTPAQATQLKLFFKQQQALRWQWTSDLTTPTAIRQVAAKSSAQNATTQCLFSITSGCK